jgi:5-methylcytosine-specific restriction enzyme A
MPGRIPKACRVRGCPATTTDPDGYCDAHKGESWNRYTAGKSRQQRGYGTEWDKLRPLILKRDKYQCQECRRNGRYVPANNVDHVIPKAQGGTDNPDNLQTLCDACHASKTAKERHKK